MPATNAAPAAPRHTNRLAKEPSPYLQQHAHNPVDWYPWGDEAFALARQQDRPILLSIGYSTCHWCHVMERESFENEAVGDYLRKHFVAIKVDREERPDVDTLYMNFVQMTTGSGGWPLNVFLTPDLKPFYGGTYFPPESKHGRPSFLQLLERITELWKTKRQELGDSAEEVAQRLLSMAAHDAQNAFPTGERELHGAGQTLVHEYDPQYGGFGGAPKFPRPSQPLFLLRYARRFGDTAAITAVLNTCDHMAAGGLYDQLGGGFSRYSVDAQWLVPHFEKMLYDQAQLVQLYLDAYLVSGEVKHATVARGIIGYVLRDLRHSQGGFFSAEDADSEGQEGKFYCWTETELKQVLTADEFAVIRNYYGITAAGNFEDHSHPQPLKHLNVLSVVHPKLTDPQKPLWESARQKLIAVRNRRVRPHRDDKVLTSWNGMMLGAVARAYAVLHDPEFLQAATANLRFLQSQLWDASTQTLYHRWRNGERDQVQLLDGYAHLLAGVIELYESTVDPRHLEFAVALAESLMKRFHDQKDGGFWQSGADTPHLLVRTKTDYDGAEPSGNSVAALALLRLGTICDRAEWRAAGEGTLRLFAQKLHQYPQAVPHLLLALDFTQQEPKRIVLVGDFTCGSTASLLQAVHAEYEPNKVVLGNRGPVEAFAKTLPENPEFTQAFCCTGTACQPPTRSRDVVREFLKKHP